MFDLVLFIEGFEVEYGKYLATLSEFEHQVASLSPARAQIQAVKATLSALAKQELPKAPLPKLGFSTAYLERHLLDHPELFELERVLNLVRQVAIENFGVWHLFSSAWCEALKQELYPGKTIELMAGNALLAKNLPATFAVDELDWKGQDNERPDPWTKVYRLDALEAVQRYYTEVNNLILAWAPETTTKDQQILAFLRQKKWSGRFIVIGEKNGATDSKRFWQEAKLNYVPSLNTLHQPFDAIKDKVFLVK